MSAWMYERCLARKRDNVVHDFSAEYALEDVDCLGVGNVISSKQKLRRGIPRCVLHTLWAGQACLIHFRTCDFVSSFLLPCRRGSGQKKARYKIFVCDRTVVLKP